MMRTAESESHGARDRRREPSTVARVVLCKELVADPGYVTFYTNYESQKGHDLAHNRLRRR